MARRSVPALIAPFFVLAGCTFGQPPPEPEVRTVEVSVPVPTMPDPPAELMAPYRPERLPDWIPPEAPAAAVCLAEPGARSLQGVVQELHARDAAWRVWVRENRKGGE